MKLTFVIENTGDTPASGISIDVKFNVIQQDYTGIAIHNVVPDNNIRPTALFLGKGVETEGYYWIDTSKGFGEVVSAIENGTAYLSIWLSVSYRDIFNEVHHANVHYSNEREDADKWKLKLGDGGSEYD